MPCGLGWGQQVNLPLRHLRGLRKIWQKFSQDVKSQYMV